MKRKYYTLACTTKNNTKLYLNNNFWFKPLSQNTRMFSLKNDARFQKLFYKNDYPDMNLSVETFESVFKKVS